MPAELWQRLAPEKRLLFECAQAILDDLGTGAAVPAADLCARLGRPLTELVTALKLLRALELIEVGPGATLRVVAVPADPIHVRGPDGRWRWIFVKRRIASSADFERAVWN
jgi:hypothetical protein